MAPKESTPEELAASRDARIAGRALEIHERYLALLRLAQRIRQDSGYPETLKRIIDSGQDELVALRQRAGGKIAPRRRPRTRSEEPRTTCTVYVDECGAHSVTTKGEFDAFCLAAVVIPDISYPNIDSQWKKWKAETLGSAEKRIHEPDVRKGMGTFYFGGSRAKRVLGEESLRRVIASLDFTGIVCVLNRPEYLKLHGQEPLDESLPTHAYLMTLHFLTERVVMVLDGQFKGARGRFVAESRGPLEDALLQYEFVRLQLDGTSYVSSTWFRHQLCPGVDFKSKRDNVTGLQLADLMARPCGEKILNPTSTPKRWPEFREKLCQDKETLHSIVGLKVVPWHERYVDIWNS
jgi:hypothetical protein